jgi:hypothetical protein
MLQAKAIFYRSVLKEIIWFMRMTIECRLLSEILKKCVSSTCTESKLE